MFFSNTKLTEQHLNLQTNVQSNCASSFFSKHQNLLNHVSSSKGDLQNWFFKLNAHPVWRMIPVGHKTRVLFVLGRELGGKNWRWSVRNWWNVVFCWSRCCPMMDVLPLCLSFFLLQPNMCVMITTHFFLWPCVCGCDTDQLGTKTHTRARTFTRTETRTRTHKATHVSWWLVKTFQNHLLPNFPFNEGIQK